ncbi:MAG: M20/M25/M40 family metallo-hydrolase [Chitinophagaceae bacterium]
MSILNAENIAFLKKYINTPMPVGFEYWGQVKWIEYVREYADEVFTDVYGTAVAIKNKDKHFKVVLEAHADEISWFVNYIDAKGLLYLQRNGGVDPQIAPSQRVLVHGKKGAVKAVFGWPAIHTRNGENRNLETKQENLFLDCGGNSKQEVEKMGIQVGSVVTYQEGFDELQNGYLVGRAFDNRIGGFMIAEVLKMLHKNKVKLPYSLHIVNAVQEEIGLRGSEMIARRIKPNVAIVTDVTHDTTTPTINQKIEGDKQCKKGPAITYGPAVHHKLNRFIDEVAKANKIPLQYSTVSRSTGTDTDSFTYANEGCPSALISIPLKYMHTTVEMIHKNDVENTIQLMYEVLCALKPTTSLRYFN